MDDNELKPPPVPAISHEERNAVILRRTLSGISWLYGLFEGLLGLLGWSGGTYPRIMAAYAALLALAGTMLWKSRRGAAWVTLAAALGSIGVALWDLMGYRKPDAALVDGSYAVIAVLLLLKSRRVA